MRPMERWGWVLFLVSAVAFTAAGIRDGDALVIGASLAFGAACVLVLLDDAARRRNRVAGEARPDET